MCSIFEHIPHQKETEQIFQWIKQLDNDRVLEVLRLQPDMINHRSRESGRPVSHYIARHGNPALKEVMLFHPKTNMYLVWETVYGDRWVLHKYARMFVYRKFHSYLSSF